MRRIVNVIYKPHLATFRAYSESEKRCCCVCDWKQSPGAKAELAFAKATGKKVL